MSSVGIYTKADGAKLECHDLLNAHCTLPAGTTVAQRVAATPEFLQVRMQDVCAPGCHSVARRIQFKRRAFTRANLPPGCCGVSELSRESIGRRLRNDWGSSLDPQLQLGV